MSRSDYTYDISFEGVVCIIDRNLGHKSVTNDIENVINDLRGNGTVKLGSKVIYRDSEGIWDQVLIAKVNGLPLFQGFASIGTRDRQIAIETVLQP